MKHYAVTIQGKTPLICHRFTDESALAATAGSHSSATTRQRQTPLERASSFLYLGLNGQPMIPQTNLLRCIVDGGRYFKAGKSQITTNEKSLLYSCLDIEETEIPIEHTEPWRVDTRAVVIPSTKGRILEHRPMFDDWRLSFTMLLDEDILSPLLLRDIVDAAGQRVGLGGYRPARKGPYGRFVVVKWSQLEA